MKRLVTIVFAALFLAILSLVAIRFRQAQAINIEASQEQVKLQQSFDQYRSDLLAKNFDAVFNSTAPEFRLNVSRTEFQKLWEDFEKQNGHLKEIRTIQFKVRGRGTPMKWVGHVFAEYFCENKSVQVIHEFHADPNFDWQLFGIDFKDKSAKDTSTK